VTEKKGWPMKSEYRRSAGEYLPVAGRSLTTSWARRRWDQIEVISTMFQTVLFCHGCNEKFAVQEGDRLCPHCGQTLAALADAPTQEFTDLAARGTYVAGTAEGPEGDDSLVGRRLATYQIEAFLGKGGMARVYRASHLMLDRPCAIKVLNPQLVARNPDMLHMFFAEARSAAVLIHPHVVTVHTIGQDEGLHFIEMEYVVGRSLQRLVEARKELELTHATRLMVQTCSALAEAHRIGMVHRDLKPSNILVTDTGLAKLADFGLAKRVVNLPGPGQGRGLVGTPYFMAPELFQGHSANTRSDVYAMGVTYFYLLTGRLPFLDTSVTNLARKHAEEAVPDLAQLRPGLPHDAISIINRCLAKRDEDRYSDAGHLRSDLEQLLRQLRDTDSLVREALSGLDVQWQGAGDRFQVLVRLPDGRTQHVFIEAGSSGALPDRLVKIYSLCAPMSESYYRRALELNADIPHGSIAIQSISGAPHFVMVNSYPRSTCDPEEVRHSVLAIARWADDVEKALTGSDRN
jgi:serine/threonine-protein kinase